MAGVNHGSRGTEDLSVYEVRVDCDCGNSTLTDRSGGNTALWHKVRVGVVPGRVSLICNICKNQYLIKGGIAWANIDVSRVATS